MATIKPGPTISRISGSQGEHVYSSWRGKQYLRSKAINRANPASMRQATARAGATALSKDWNDTLSDSQRGLWEEFAKAGSPALDPASSREQGSRVVIPQPKPVLSGYDAFVRANQRLILTGIRAIGNPIFVPSRVSPSPPTGLIRDEAPPTPINFALDFDGINEDVLLGNVLGYEYNEPWAWDIWYWHNPEEVTSYLVTKGTEDPFRGYRIIVRDDVIDFHISEIWATRHLWVQRSVSLVSQWVHLVCSYDGSNSAVGMKIYVNSVLGQVVMNNTPIITTITTTNPLTFASANAVPGNYLAGRMDAVRTFDRNLIQPRVDTLFNAGAGLYGGDPLADGSCLGAWMFCNGVGNELFDITDPPYDGTLRNMEDVDWVPGHVPCPDRPGAKQLEWSDPDDLPVGGKIRLWLLSYDANVHRQHVATIDRGVEAFIPATVRVAQGASVPIASMPGHYLFQLDAIHPNGNQSPPSNTIESICPFV